MEKSSMSVNNEKLNVIRTDKIRGSGARAREAWLDILKLLACIIVFIDHFYLCFKKEIPAVTAILRIPPFGLLISGNLAVALFIMISAMLAAMSVYRKPRFHTVQKAAFKRYPRLFLPVFALSFITWGMRRLSLFYNGQAAEAMGGYKRLAGYFTGDMSFLSLIRKTVYDVFWTGNNTFNAPFWMMSVLFLGTFTALILAVITAHPEGSGRAVGYDLSIFLFMTLLSYPEGNYLLCIVLGCFLAYLRCCTRFFEKLSTIGAVRVLACLMLAGSIILSLKYGTVVKYLKNLGIEEGFLTNRIFYRSLSAAGILASFQLLSGLRRGFDSTKLLKKLSALSFSIYLVHWPILCSFSCWMYVQLKPAVSDAYVLIAWIFAATCAAVLVCAYLFWKFIEQGLCGRIMGWIGKKWEI